MQQQEMHSEQILYQNKYGYMKDYISSKKDEKKKMQQQNENGVDFNNKNLISYLEDKENEQNSLINEIKQKRKEDTIIHSSFMIQSGFNVCIHGVGSKKKILDEISNLFIDIPKLVIRGYSPASQLQQIMKKLQYIVTKVTGTSVSGSKRSEGISQYLKEAEEQMDKLSSKIPYILIIFHNLDAKQYLEQDQVKILAKILNLSYVRAVCSIDHVKYFMCVTPKALERFNFSFLEYNSYDCYLSEFKVGQNTFTLKKEKEGEALKFIMRSLTKVQKEIIQLLAKYIRDKLVDIGANSLGTSYISESGKVFGLTLKELLEMLIDEMVLNSEQQLKENLLEILDHKIFISVEVQQKTYYTMNYSKFILDKIIEDRLEEEEDEDDGEEEEYINENDNNQQVSSSNNVSSDENNEEIYEEKKVKRKYQRKQQKQSSKNSGESEPNSEDEQDQKKGRGKQPLKNKKKAEKSDESESSEVEQVAQTQKKRRGRPSLKKQQSSEKSEESESSSEDEQPIQNQKRRGRPPLKNNQQQKKTKGNMAESDEESED